MFFSSSFVSPPQLTYALIRAKSHSGVPFAKDNSHKVLASPRTWEHIQESDRTGELLYLLLECTVTIYLPPHTHCYNCISFFIFSAIRLVCCCCVGKGVAHAKKLSPTVRRWRSICAFIRERSLTSANCVYWGKPSQYCYKSGLWLFDNTRLSTDYNIIAAYVPVFL